MVQTIEEVRLQLKNMESHFDSGFSYLEQQFLEKLNYLLFKKGITNKGCQDCYRDAYIIITNKVKNMTELPQEKSYILKAGVVLHPFGTSDFYILGVEDEVAESWLHDHPDQISMFQKYPEDYLERISARFAPETSINVADEETTTEEPKTQQRQKKTQKKGK